MCGVPDKTDTKPEDKCSSRIWNPCIMLPPTCTCRDFLRSPHESNQSMTYV